MPIIRDFANGNQVADYTQELLVVPNKFGTIQQLGLFQEEGVDQYVVQFEEITKDGAILVDAVRGQRATVGKDYTRKVRSWAIPHFPHDDFILPGDVKGKRAYGKPDQEDTLAEVRMRKIERMALNHNQTLEYARAKAITTGDVYAPNGTVALNFYTEFGIVQPTVDFLFGTGTTNMIGKTETAIQTIMDNSAGQSVSGIIGLASRAFFSKLISHANVTAAYQQYASVAEPLRNRLGGTSGAIQQFQRQFVYGGITYIEMADSYNGNALIPAGECYFVPTGTDAFKTFFAPANRFDLLGTIGERMYMFEYTSPRGDKLELESESNYLNAVTRPGMVVKGYTSN